ncbi:hypothetical protein V2J09_009217 [Rumex salicifolius]
MCRIVSTLRLCGETVKEEDMLEKIFSSFHASNLVLQQQYRERGFKPYSELHTCLILAKENNQLLLHNHQNCPVGSAPIPDHSQAVPEANATSYQKGRGRGQGHGRYHGRDGKGQEKGAIIHGSTQISKGTMETSPRNQINKTDLRSRICRAPAHVMTAYQDSLQDKEKNVETNFANASPTDLRAYNTEFETSDFLNLDEKDGSLPEMDALVGEFTSEDNFLLW